MGLSSSRLTSFAHVSRLMSRVKPRNGKAIAPLGKEEEKAIGIAFSEVDMRRETRDERRQETIRRWTGDVRRRDRKKKSFSDFEIQHF